MPNESYISLADLVKISLPLAIAIGGWIFTYWSTERDRSKDNAKERKRRSEEHIQNIEEHKRDSQLERLNAQIEKLYGPLHAKLASGEAVWTTFWKMYRPQHGKNAYFYHEETNTEEELKTWRIWIEHIFQPTNRELVQVIVENAHLIDIDTSAEDPNFSSNAKSECYFPTAFLELIAHAKAYDGVIKTWESGDFRKHTAENNFPPNLRTMVAEKYFELIERRQKLLPYSKQSM